MRSLTLCKLWGRAPHNSGPRNDTWKQEMEQPNQTTERKEYQPRFGRLLLVCGLAVVFCGWLVWFASTYLTDCCGP